MCMCCITWLKSSEKFLNHSITFDKNSLIVELLREFDLAPRLRYVIIQLNWQLKQTISSKNVFDLDILLEGFFCFYF